jgi:DNA-binding response OmpR family regulator
MFSDEGTGALILVVHDIEETRDGIEKLLQSSGYRVDPARDKKEAMWRALRQPPDLILVSLCGPEACVIATAQHVRDGSGLPEDVPVVIFGVETLAEGTELQIGINVYLARPGNFDDLRTLLARLLRQPRSGRSGRASRQPRIVDHTRP